MNENITFTLSETIESNRENVSYEELLEEVNNMDDFVAIEVNYECNFTKKELVRIAEYYELEKCKRIKKKELIRNIVLFEKNPENTFIVFQRKKLWDYIREIKDDNYLRKFLLW